LRSAGEARGRGDPRPYGAHLIDPDYDQIFVVPRDVMEHLIRHDIIELEREQ
jgi:hypothetical protein